MSETGRKPGKVYLIGAGPGDPGLLTIKAAACIRASDLVVYDHLVNPEVLAHARHGVELVYAGKQASNHSRSQSEINRLLVDNARAGRTVARVKGGDPFVFGRGGEEAEALHEAGVAWEVVPGVTSAVAAAAYAGIPLTHRDHSSSVAFITGHDGRSNGRGGVDWGRAAWAADTLAIFMCAETISKISLALIEAGRPASTPIAIIRWGTYEHQEVFRGALEDLACTEPAHVEPPAIAIVGEVASLADKLSWFGSASDPRPLRPARAEELTGEIV